MYNRKKHNANRHPCHPCHPCECHATAMPHVPCPPPHGATRIHDRRRRGRTAVIPPGCAGGAGLLAPVSPVGRAHGTYSVCCGISGLGWGLPFWNLGGIVRRFGTFVAAGAFVFLGLLGEEVGWTPGGLWWFVCVQFGDSCLGGEEAWVLGSGRRRRARPTWHVTGYKYTT